MNTMPPSAQVLVVDDERPIREMLIGLLGDEGYAVAGAANGQDALTYLHHSSELPQLILLDLNMPIMSGWQFRDHQQQDPILRQIPVVVISASTHIKQLPPSFHAAGYIAKPIQLNVLIETVEHYCTA